MSAHSTSEGYRETLVSSMDTQGVFPGSPMDRQGVLMTDFGSLLEDSGKPLASECAKTDCNINNFNENVRLAYTRAQL